MNQSEIENITNVSFITELNGATDNQFNVGCQFVPDVIQAQMAMNVKYVDADNQILTPLYGEEAKSEKVHLHDLNIFELRSDLLPTDTLAVCNATNSFNPVYTFMNNGRQSFNSTYRLTVFNLTRNEVVTAGKVMVHLTFIRYKTK